MRLPLCIVLLLLLAAVTACEEPRAGAIVGDVYLAPRPGAEINLGSASVHLLGREKGLDTLLAPLCPPREGVSDAVRTAARERAWVERERILRPRVLRSVRTNAAAQFMIDSVPPGRYRLWADTVVEGTRWTWLAPVVVPEGDTVRLNLSNANPDENPFRCEA